jgi:hypothetical protein
MLFITGDTHGDFSRLSAESWPRGECLTKDDYVVVLGDFGLNLEERTESFEYWRDWLAARPFTTLWIDGNHENFGWLDSIEPEPWNGGMIHKCDEEGKVLHLMRGEVFHLGEKSLLAIGGSYCACDESKCHIEKLMKPEWHLINKPLPEDFSNAYKNLDRVGWKADYVVTHCPTTRMQYAIGEWWLAKAPAEYTETIKKFLLPNETSEPLQEIADKLDYCCWYAGHFHADYVADDRHKFLRFDIVEA